MAKLKNLKFNKISLLTSGKGWMRFFDGTQVCYGTYGRSTSSGDFVDTVFFPVAFANDDIVISLTPFKNTNDTSYRSIQFTILTQKQESFFFGGYGNSQTWKMHWMAIGKWQ